MTQAGENDGFCLLAATLLDALPSSRPGLISLVPDTLLMQLHAIFGPMLLSALQLIDRREVVLVSLPGGRTIYQVTSSTGQPYTLYTFLPPITPLPSGPEPVEVETARSPSPTPAPTDPFVEPTSHQPPVPPSDAGTTEVDTTEADERKAEQLRQYEVDRGRRVRVLAQGMKRLYCPCAGFLFNSLGGERNMICKHLLSVLIAHHTAKMVRTEVYLPGVVELLGLGKKVDDVSAAAAVAA